MTGKAAVLVCENYQAEAEAVLESEGYDKATIITFPAHCHKVQKMQCNFLCEIPSIDLNGYSRIDLLCGGCVSPQKQSASSCHKCTFHSLDICFYMLADVDAVDEYLRNGAYLLTPGWLERWPQYLDEWGFDDDVVAIEFFEESASKLVLLDTQVSNDSKRQLEEFANKVRRPFEIVPVGLDHFRKFLKKSLGG